MGLTEIIDVVRSVREAQRRVYIGGATFFGKQDIWLYVEVSDQKLCPVCRGFAQAGVGDNVGEYRGNRIRGFFPYLEILDVNTIKVNVHPNCRCVLVRVHRINWRELD